MLYTLKKYQAHIPVNIAYKVLCTDDKFSNPVILCRGKNAINLLIYWTIYKKYGYCKQIIKSHFNKILSMSEEDEKTLNKVIFCGHARK